MRSFPFRGWELGNVTDDDVALWGWEPIPEEQTTLSEVLLEEGYQTFFVTDTLHQFRASYNFHRGFRVYEWVRGQERDHQRLRSCGRGGLPDGRPPDHPRNTAEAPSGGSVGPRLPGDPGPPGAA